MSLLRSYSVSSRNCLSTPGKKGRPGAPSSSAPWPPAKCCGSGAPPRAFGSGNSSPRAPIGSAGGCARSPSSSLLDRRPLKCPSVRKS